MPRKQRTNKSSNTKQGSANNSADNQSRLAQRPSGDSGVGFPPHLLRSYNHSHSAYEYENDPSDALETLVPNAVFVARNALSSKECQEWIAYAEDGNRWDAVSHPATKWIAHRECGRIQKNDWNMSHRLYERIQSTVEMVSPQLGIFDKATLQPNGVKCNSTNKSGSSQPKYKPVSCNPNLRLYKYTKGQWFGRHVDGTNKIDFNDGDNPPISASDVKEAQTEITVLFYLSSCRGGATRFHLPQQGKRKKGGSSGIAFTPEEGAVLLHVHGDRCLEHEAEPVLDGVKYVLRTDIVYGIV